MYKRQIYQIAESNRKKIDSVARIELNLFCPNWNALVSAFSALTLLVGRQEGHPACKKLSGGVLAWLSDWSEVQTCIWPSGCHCHSLSLASAKSRLVFPFRYRLTWVVADKGPLNGCVCVWNALVGAELAVQPQQRRWDDGTRQSQLQPALSSVATDEWVLRAGA